MSVGEMIDMILSEAAQHIRVVIDPKKARAAERSSLCGTTDRLRSLIGYTPEAARRQTIRTILDEAQLQVLAAPAAFGDRVG